MKKLLTVQSLKKYFPVYGGLLSRVVGQVKAVDDVSFDIYEGEEIDANSKSLAFSLRFQALDRTLNIEEVDNKSQDDLDDITVVPNPFIVFSDFQGAGDHQLRFTRLPLKCTIAIYTINGELVKRIYHEATFDGNEVWDLKNEGGNYVAPGLYIYVIEADNAKKIDKFAIIR